MTSEGPPLATLMHRLAETPPEFLMEPSIDRPGIAVAAVVADLLRDLGDGIDFESPFFTKFFPAAHPPGQPPPLPRRGKQPPELPGAISNRNRARVILIASWLLHDRWFREQQRFAESTLNFLSHDLDNLASVVEAPLFVTDAERQEELVRVCLRGLDLRPAGESSTQAEDRLTTLDSIELQRIVQATAKAEERARQVREAMVKKAAEEAAAKATRE